MNRTAMKEEVARARYWRDFMLRVRRHIIATRYVTDPEEQRKIQERLKESIMQTGNSTINAENSDTFPNFYCSVNNT